ncbi:TonB-linked SusC/RagA family outer membrane protein [Mucilaginibacter rubeus]|uniref:SusC/RagA family TonB-linked outer membrane protein n=1 Tax=Mucilaginibacter rubeus TaxID=2027860 RepID=UPI00339AB5BD
MYNFYPKKLVQPPGCAPNILLIMKLTTLFFVAAILQASASTFAQKVTLSEKNTPLKPVFEKISDQTGYDFIVSSEDLRIAKPVTIITQNEDLKKVLDEIFAYQPLAFTIQDRMVVVSKKSVQSTTVKSSDQMDIHGVIVDESGNPLPGATIRIKGTQMITMSGKDGAFYLKIGITNPVLSVSFVGYQIKEYAVTANSPEQIRIQLLPIVGELNQIQIIGYGTTTKRFNTGSTGTVSASEIANQPVTNPLAALQGKVSGVFVQTQNGLPGGGIKVQIRGQGSLASGTDPLYIVDGIPFLSSPLSGLTSASGANGPINPLSIINPDDIESIDILKDADATAIYGSRAANGVVLITTKKGSKGKETFSINISQGISRISRLDNPLLNLCQYLLLRREAFSNDGEIPDAFSAPDLINWDTTRSTNWQKYFYGGTAHVSNLQGSLSGGDEHNQYLISGNYHRETTILPGDQSYIKGGGYLTFTHHSNNNRFTATTSVNYNKDNNKTLYSSITSQNFLLPPNFPIYNNDGSYNWDIPNPVAFLQQRQNSQSDYLNINEMLDYKVSKAITVHVNSGYNNYQVHQIATLPLLSQDPSIDPVATAYFADNLSQKYILEPQLNFNYQIGDGHFTALAGATYQFQKNTGSLIEGDGVSNATLLGNLGAASVISAHVNTYSLYKYASIFSRANYNWRDKYLLDLNFRRDGSSRFGANHQFGNFYAVGAAWIFSEESFIKTYLPIISFGKLRGSFGTTGNDQIADYQYLASYGTGPVYDNIATLVPNRVANPDYSWETTHKVEAALELGVVSNRLLFTAAWYRHLSSNQLIAYKIPYLTGFATYQANFPATIQNTGIELDLDARVIQNKNFRWRSSVNLTLPKNKLKSFANLAGSSYANNYVIGQDLSVYKGLHFLGVDKQTGNASFEDINHDGVINVPGDLVVLGKTSPDLFGGWSNTIGWKDIELNFSWEFVKRNYPGYQPLLGGYPQNDPQFVAQRWKQPGDISNIPRASIDLSSSQYNSSQLLNANYARLKNASISYSMPSYLTQRIGVKILSIYLNGENLFVIANKSRFDPELSGTNIGIPPLKTFVLGLKGNF